MADNDTDSDSDSDGEDGEKELATEHGSQPIDISEWEKEGESISEKEARRRRKMSHSEKGNSYAEGHGAPKGNQNGAKHFAYSDPDKLLPWLEENKPKKYEWVVNKYESYLTDAPFSDGSAKADKLMETCVCEFVVWRNRGVQVRDGVVTKTHMKGSDGQLVEVDAERPNNQAVNRMDRQVMSKLKELGVLDSPDDRKADALEQMANEDYVIDVEGGPVESDD